jgi:hypothetical protein
MVSLSSVSCASAGNCSAVGSYTTRSGAQQGLLLTETAGVRVTAAEASLPAEARAYPMVDLASVSCASAGNCAADGRYMDRDGNEQGLLLSERSGAWATGVRAQLPADAGAHPDAALGWVSCRAAGECTASGTYHFSSGDSHGVLLSETAGAWTTGVEASPPMNASSNSNVWLGSVSCATVRVCTAIGMYTDSAGGVQGLLVSAAPVSPTLSTRAPANAKARSPIPASLISSTLAGGSAPTGRLTFAVFGPRSTPPVSCASGATVVGSVRVSGNRAYHPSKRFTPARPGDYWWYARYGGDPSDHPAASVCGRSMPETVVRAGPALSAVRLASSRVDVGRGTELKVTVSHAATVTVLITQTMKGREVNGVCKRHAERGPRCTATRAERRLTLSASAGVNTFHEAADRRCRTASARRVRRVRSPDRGRSV